MTVTVMPMIIMLYIYVDPVDVFLSQKGRKTERGELIKLKTEIAFAVSSYVHTFLCPEHCVNK